MRYVNLNCLFLRMGMIPDNPGSFWYRLLYGMALRDSSRQKVVNGWLQVLLFIYLV